MITAIRKTKPAEEGFHAYLADNQMSWQSLGAAGYAAEYRVYISKHFPENKNWRTFQMFEFCNRLRRDGDKLQILFALYKGLERGLLFQDKRVSTDINVLVRIIREAMNILFHDDHTLVWKKEVFFRKPE